MRKIIVFILALSMVFALSACKINVNPSSSDEQNIGVTDNQAESSVPADENDNQNLSDNEMLAGLWVCTDDINDGIVEFAIFSTDGYVYTPYYYLDSEGEFDEIIHFINFMQNDKTSRAIEEYCEYTYEEHYSIEDLYQDEEVGKYNAKNGEVTVIYSCGDEETLYFDPTALVLATDDNCTLEKIDYSLDDSFRYFVGNWNYEQTELYSYYYTGYVQDHYDNGLLFFGEDFRANESDGDTGGWGYNDGILEIGSSHYNVIKLSQKSFIIYAEYKHETYAHYEFAIFNRV